MNFHIGIELRQFLWRLYLWHHNAVGTAVDCGLYVLRQKGWLVVYSYIDQRAFPMQGINQSKQSCARARLYRRCHTVFQIEHYQIRASVGCFDKKTLCVGRNAQ